MSRCIVCGRDSTRYHSNHNTGELQHLCELHYSWHHPSLVDWDYVSRMRLTDEERIEASKNRLRGDVIYG